MRLLPRAWPERRGGSRGQPRRGRIRPAEQVSVFVRPPDGRLLPARRRVRRAYGRGGTRGPPAGRARNRSARRGLRRAGLQPRLESRPNRGRRNRRPRPPPCGPPLGGGHELHARPRRRESAPRAPDRNPPPAGGRLAYVAKSSATASIVRSISSSPCAVERNIASFWLGAR